MATPAVTRLCKSFRLALPASQPASLSAYNIGQCSHLPLLLPSYIWTHTYCKYLLHSAKRTIPHELHGQHHLSSSTALSLSQWVSCFNPLTRVAFLSDQRVTTSHRQLLRRLLRLFLPSPTSSVCPPGWRAFLLH